MHVGVFGIGLWQVCSRDNRVTHIVSMSQSLVTVIQTQHVKPNYWKMTSNLAEQKDTGVSGEAFAFWVGESFWPALGFT